MKHAAHTLHATLVLSSPKYKAVDLTPTLQSSAVHPGQGCRSVATQAGATNERVKEGTGFILMRVNGVVGQSPEDTATIER